MMTKDKTKKRLPLGIALAVILVALGSQALAEENVRFKGPVQDNLINWVKVDRPDGPLTEFGSKRDGKISDYFHKVAVLNSDYKKAVNELYKIYEGIMSDPTKTEKEKSDAKSQYDGGLETVKNNWISGEQVAYDALVKGLRDDYNYAVQRRVGEYRNARRRISYYLKLSARSKKRAWGPRYHSYTHIPEDDIAIPRVSDCGEAKGVEWEQSVTVDWTNFNVRGGSIARHNVYGVPDVNKVGIRIDFEVNGMDVHRSTTWRTVEADPWCEFRPTQAWSERQARNDMGGLTDVDLVTCQKLLDAKNFKRAQKPWE